VARRLPSAILAGLLAAACGASQPSASPVITPASSFAPAASGPFAGQPYALDLPDGWVAFDLADPSGSDALDTFVAANPEMGAAIEAFKQLPGVAMAVNQTLGNVVVSLSVPTAGLALDGLASSFTAQFAAVPGVVSPPKPNDVQLPVGRAIHWDVKIEANKPDGGTYQVGESVYLVANDTTAVLVEFVEVGGASMPQEDSIMQTLRFTP
jgi:hypothetical protein